MFKFYWAQVLPAPIIIILIIIIDALRLKTSGVDIKILCGDRARDPGCLPATKSFLIIFVIHFSWMNKLCFCTRDWSSSQMWANRALKKKSRLKTQRREQHSHLRFYTRRHHHHRHIVNHDSHKYRLFHSCTLFHLCILMYYFTARSQASCLYAETGSQRRLTHKTACNHNGTCDGRGDAADWRCH